MTTDEPHRYEIRIEGHLGHRWGDWFEGLTLENAPDGQTILSGLLCDQAALFGVLTEIHDLNLTLISVQRLSPPPKAEGKAAYDLSR